MFLNIFLVNVFRNSLPVNALSTMFSNIKRQNSSITLHMHQSAFWALAFVFVVGSAGPKIIQQMKNKRKTSLSHSQHTCVIWIIILRFKKPHFNYHAWISNDVRLLLNLFGKLEQFQERSRRGLIHWSCTSGVERNFVAFSALSFHEFTRHVSFPKVKVFTWFCVPFFLN